MKSRCKQTARKSFPCPNYPKTAIKSTPPATKATSNESARLTPKTIIGKFGQDCVLLFTSLNQTAAAAPSSPVTSVTPAMTSVGSVITSTPKAALPQIQQLDAMRTTNGYLILQPQQQQDNLVFLPPNHTISYTTPLANIANQVVSMVSIDRKNLQCCHRFYVFKWAWSETIQGVFLFQWSILHHQLLFLF